MKYLKLFEAFSQDEKIEGANNIVIEYLLFNSFVKNDIIVKRDYNSPSKGIGGIEYKAKNKVFNFFERWIHPQLIGSIFEADPIVTHVEIWCCDASRDYKVEPNTIVLEGYLKRAFLGYIDINQLGEIARRCSSFSIYEIKGAGQAAKRYIDYLKMTPEKKYLLKE